MFNRMIFLHYTELSMFLRTARQAVHSSSVLFVNYSHTILQETCVNEFFHSTIVSNSCSSISEGKDHILTCQNIACE